MPTIDDLIDQVRALPPVGNDKAYQVRIGSITIDKIVDGTPQPWFSSGELVYQNCSYADIIGIQAAQLATLEKLLDLGVARAGMGGNKKGGN